MLNKQTLILYNLEKIFDHKFYHAQHITTWNINFDLTIKKQTSRLQNRPKISTDILPKKQYIWQMSIGHQGNGNQNEMVLHAARMAKILQPQNQIS